MNAARWATLTALAVWGSSIGLACGARTPLREDASGPTSSTATSNATSSSTGASPAGCDRATLATGLSQPFFLRGDATSLYFIDQGSPSNVDDATLYRADASAGYAPVVLQAPLSGAGDLLLDGDRLVWSELPHAVVRACATPDCAAPSTIFTDGGDPPILFAADATDLYIFTYHALLRCEKPGCANAETLATSAYGSVAMTADASDVYWIDATPPGTVFRCPKPHCTGGPQAVASSFPTLPLGITLDDARLYLSVGGAAAADDGVGEIVSCPKSTGCGDQPTVLAKGLDHPVEIAVDDQRVVWVDQGSAAHDFTDGDVRSCDKVTCPSADVLASLQRLPRSLLLSDGCAYWATDGTFVQPTPPGVTGTIERVNEAP